MKILVTGGAGYIGSITVKALIKEGFEVIVFDNLINGYKENVTTRLIEGDLLDKSSFSKLDGEKFDGVIHFAAYALAGESMENPYKYFENNILGGLNLLEYMRNNNINNIVFSSTCAIFGTPEKLPVSEDLSKNPESVYGQSKLMFEQVLDWYGKIYGIKHINLRYFNAAGASLDGSLGEEHNPETHIIPVAINALLNNEPFYLFGNDYPTFDGTCVRDYIHVEDLAAAHVLALQKLQENGKSDNYNLGTGNGYSNLQIIDMIEKISEKKLLIVNKPRREGDPPQIFADNKKAREELGFEAKYSDLETIIKTAWDWHQRHSNEK